MEAQRAASPAARNSTVRGREDGIRRLDFVPFDCRGVELVRVLVHVEGEAECSRKQPGGVNG